MKYKVNVRFTGAATIEIEAASTDEARQNSMNLTIADLARAGHVDVTAFQIAAKEITAISALGGGHGYDDDPDGPQKPRPSGWYRPG
jgi:hypothetical protein